MKRSILWQTTGFFFISVLSHGIPVFGQESESATAQFWIDVNPQRHLSENTDIYGEVGLRRDGENGEFKRLIVRANIRQQLGPKTKVTGGVGSFFTWNTDANNRWEVRPWAGLRVTSTRELLPLDHYARLELRTERDTQTWETVRSLRLRYRLRTHVNLSSFKPGRYWRVLGSGEVFGTITGEQGQFQEYFRLIAALERSFSTGLRIRSEVTWQKEGRIFQEASTDAIYLRIRFFKTI